MRVGRRENHLVDVEVGQRLAHRRFEGVVKRLPDDHGVHADDHRRVQDFVAVARFQNENVGSHRAGDAPGDAGVELPGKKHGLVGSDVARGGADQEFGAAHRDRQHEPDQQPAEHRRECDANQRRFHAEILSKGKA